MQIAKSTIEKITITGAQRREGFGHLDPIAVMIDDYGQGAAKVTITCFGEAWSHYWSHMGEGVSLMDFFIKASDDYIVCKLKTGIDDQVQDLDPDKMEKALKAEIIRLRREYTLSRECARDYWDRAGWVGEADYADIFSDVFRDEWWYSLPQKPNHDYEYLKDIVRAVKAAFKQLKEQPC